MYDNPVLKEPLDSPSAVLLDVYDDLIHVCIHDCVYPRV